MSVAENVVLLVDPNLSIRGLLVSQLAPLGFTVLEASDGEEALRVLGERHVSLVVAELYLKAGEDDDLIHAVRRSKALRKTRTLAHTSRSSAADRDWALRVGADAFLIKPTRPERLRYVVGRLCTPRGANASVPVTTKGSQLRRNSLEEALAELESGDLKGTATIVFSRPWWQGLSPNQQAGFRRRAKKVRVSLRSDSLLGNHFVEVRGRASVETSLSSEREESPYKQAEA